MPNQCPQCLQVFGDHVKFCNRDGATLDFVTTREDSFATSKSPPHLATSKSPPHQGGRYKRLWLIAIPLSLAVVTVVAGFLWLRAHLQSRVAVSLEGITLSGSAAPSQGDERPSLIGRVVDLAQAATGNHDLSARLKVANSTIFSGAVKSATYTITAGGTEIGKGAWDPGSTALNFKAGEEFSLDLPFRLNPGNAVASALDALSGQSIPVEMRGEMGVEVFAITFSIPFRARLATPGKALPRSHVDTETERRGDRETGRQRDRRDRGTISPSFCLSVPMSEAPF